jgi:hypothetical protein
MARLQSGGLVSRPAEPHDNAVAEPAPTNTPTEARNTKIFLLTISPPELMPEGYHATVRQSNRIPTKQQGNPAIVQSLDGPQTVFIPGTALENLIQAAV